jgi:transcriptional regulator with XRE-family HTH domain
MVKPFCFRLRSGSGLMLRAALGRWDWGTVLTAAGSEARLSQTQLAMRVGVSQAQVSRLMSGHSKEPGIRTVLGIVDALGIPRLLAGLAPRGLDHLTRQGDEPAVTVDAVERRTLGKAIIGITLAIPLADTQPGEPVDVTRLQPNAVVADLYALVDRYGGAAIADIARRRLVRLTRQMDNAVVSPAVETRMQSMVGELASAVRQDVGAFQKARRAAWTHMQHAGRMVRPAWFRFFDERELSALEAIGLMELGKNAEAAGILADVIGQQHTYVRNKAYYAAVRAQALMAAGAPDEAAEVVHEALPVFTEVTSARIFDRLGLVRHGLQPYLSNPDVAECADVLDGLVS